MMVKMMMVKMMMVIVVMMFTMNNLILCSIIHYLCMVAWSSFMSVYRPFRESRSSVVQKERYIIRCAM